MCLLINLRLISFRRYSNFFFFFFQIDKEQADLARANFFIIKKEAQGILDLVLVTSVLI